MVLPENVPVGFAGAGSSRKPVLAIGRRPVVIRNASGNGIVANAPSGTERIRLISEVFTFRRKWRQLRMRVRPPPVLILEKRLKNAEVIKRSPNYPFSDFKK